MKQKKDLKKLKRTHKCLKCGKCCISNDMLSGSAVIIFPSDIPSISKGLGISSIAFLKDYCKKMTLPSGLIIYVLNNLTERCMFLTSDNLCSIHSFKPIQCKKAPYNFFFKHQNWNHLPCIHDNLLYESNSYLSDRILAIELIDGYNKYIIGP